ncbi:MAG: hypothetical protein AAF191_12655 [Verrucomicrobiota bacterium]
MKFLFIQRYPTCLSLWVALFLSLSSPSWAQPERDSEEGLKSSLEAWIPHFAARRLHVRDFAEFFGGLADLFQVQRIEAYVAYIEEMPDGTVEVIFEVPSEMDESVEAFELSWSTESDGPLPLQQGVGLSLWVTPTGGVTGFEVGRVVHSWRHLVDGRVELRIAEQTLDGATVLLPLIPDRYSGSATGVIRYWEGEGTTVGSAGEVPRRRLDDPNDMIVEVPSPKSEWIQAGPIHLDEEIAGILSLFPDIRGESQVSIPSSQGQMIPVAKGLNGWSGSKEKPRGMKKTTRPRETRVMPSSTGANRWSSASRGSVETTPPVRSSSSAEATSRHVQPAPMAVPELPKGPLEEPPIAETPPPSEPKLPLNLWEEALFSLAEHRMARALALWERSRSPGTAESREWVRVRTTGEKGIGEADLETLPAVPKAQFVPESL